MKRDARLVRLSWDHHHGLVLARRIRNEAHSVDLEELANLYSHVIAQWSAQVLPHFHAEADCLLSRLLRHSGTEALVERTASDHLDIQGLVAEMRDATTIAERRRVLLQFGQRLHDHIRWEEAELFARSQEVMTSAELDAMATEVTAWLGPDVVG